MFGIGMTEIIVIFIIALLVVGPKKLPELARHLGKGLAEFRRATDDLQQTFKDEYSDLEGDVTFGESNDVDAETTDDFGETPSDTSDELSSSAEDSAAEGAESPAAGSAGERLGDVSASHATDESAESSPADEGMTNRLEAEESDEAPRAGGEDTQEKKNDVE